MSSSFDAPQRRVYQRAFDKKMGRGGGVAQRERKTKQSAGLNRESNACTEHGFLTACLCLLACACWRLAFRLQSAASLCSSHSARAAVCGRRCLPPLSRSLALCIQEHMKERERRGKHTYIHVYLDLPIYSYMCVERSSTEIAHDQKLCARAKRVLLMACLRYAASPCSTKSTR